MQPYENKYALKKKGLYLGKNYSKKISSFKLKIIHKILDTINISLLVLVFILSFLSLNSQRKWSKTYRILSKTKSNNNNLIDYISKTEESYISKLESLNSYKKTTPKDLIYIDRTMQKRDNYLKKISKIIMIGLRDSRYQRGY